MSECPHKRTATFTYVIRTIGYKEVTEVCLDCGKDIYFNRTTQVATTSNDLAGEQRLESGSGHRQIQG